MQIPRGLSAPRPRNHRHQTRKCRPSPTARNSLGRLERWRAVLRRLSPKRHTLDWPGQWTAHTEGTQPELEQRMCLRCSWRQAQIPWTGPAAKSAVSNTRRRLSRGYLPAEDVPHPETPGRLRAAATLTLSTKPGALVLGQGQLTGMAPTPGLLRGQPPSPAHSSPSSSRCTCILVSARLPGTDL